MSARKKSIISSYSSQPITSGGSIAVLEGRSSANSDTDVIQSLSTMSHFFDGKTVRCMLIDDEPWFVGKDIALILGYAKPENAISRHCKAATTTPKQGGGVLTIIPDRDVYRLIFRSKLPEAQRFEEWVVSEVLPSIRKRGMFVEGQQKIRTELLDALADNIREKALPALREYDMRTENLHWIALKRPDEYRRRCQLEIDQIALEFDLPRSLAEALTQQGLGALTYR